MNGRLPQEFRAGPTACGLLARFAAEAEWSPFDHARMERELGGAVRRG